MHQATTLHLCPCVHVVGPRWHGDGEGAVLVRLGYEVHADIGNVPQFDVLHFHWHFIPVHPTVPILVDEGGAVEGDVEG